jgi:hypothetical protein
MKGAFDHGVTSLTTIATPHMGCSLVDNKERDSSDLEIMERAFEIVGLSNQNVSEFMVQNMAHFNEVVEDHPAVGYYSFGSKKKEMHMSKVLRPGF